MGCTGLLLSLLLVGPAAAVPVLPHHAQLCPGVHVAGFSDRHRCANCGWIVLGDHVLLVDLPRGVAVPDFVAEVARTTDKPCRRLVLTSTQPGDAAIVKTLLGRGVRRVLASAAARTALLAERAGIDTEVIVELSGQAAIGDKDTPIDFLPLEGSGSKEAAAVHLPRTGVLFAGPAIVNGPRAPLPGSNTAAWVDSLDKLASLSCKHMVPGRGSWAGPEALARQRRFLAELRRQVAHSVARGRDAEALKEDVHLPGDCFVWPPYDTPTPEDLLHVRGELTVPLAPFAGRLPRPDDRTQHALVLIGDEPHEPGHIEDGLRPVFAAARVTPHFTVDVRALTADNLAHVQLLVILRDGLQRPGGGRKPYVWMTREQEDAVVRFVTGGAGFLNLHNALGLYPENGPYLRLAGGRYTGHGPLERFRVEVADAEHPITHGVEPFSVADEQHAPEHDGKVHLLLRARSDDGKVTTAGWAYEPGRGRLCHLAPGHTREALLRPMYQRLLTNAVLWCLRREAAIKAP